MIRPTEFWDGNKDFEFIFNGCSDSDFAKEGEHCRRVRGCSTFPCEASVSIIEKIQESMTDFILSFRW
jgi:hypothetical protein